VVVILQKLYSCEAHDLGLNYINELIMRFCHCPKWVGRQAFAFICQVHFTSNWSFMLYYPKDLQSHHLYIYIHVVLQYFLTSFIVILLLISILHRISYFHDIVG